MADNQQQAEEPQQDDGPEPTAAEILREPATVEACQADLRRAKARRRLNSNRCRFW